MFVFDSLNLIDEANISNVLIGTPVELDPFSETNYVTFPSRGDHEICVCRAVLVYCILDYLGCGYDNVCPGDGKCCRTHCGYYVMPTLGRYVTTSTVND